MELLKIAVRSRLHGLTTSEGSLENMSDEMITSFAATYAQGYFSERHKRPQLKENRGPKWVGLGFIQGCTSEW